MVKLVDTADLKSAAARRAGSIPASRTKHCPDDGTGIRVCLKSRIVRVRIPLGAPKDKYYMLVKIFINDKYYKTVETGPNETTHYDPARLTQIVQDDKKMGLLNQFGINEKKTFMTQSIGIQIGLKIPKSIASESVGSWALRLSNFFGPT